MIPTAEPSLPTIRIHDTLAGRKVDLDPIEPGHLRVYVCGPTVYDLIHMGNARSFLCWDVAVRHLRARGYRVTYVRNVTDVDDKIIKRAAQLGEPPAALAERFTAEFERDMDALGLLRPDVVPRVTTHMAEIVALVARLVERGLGYVVDGDVYFEVRRFGPYGQLSGRAVDDLRSGARVEVDERKRDPLDFALWKSAKPGEPAWESPWGAGRPGWHIECSAMSARYLGETFDLHCGGTDLVFPHHENELAQSQGAHGAGTFARHWVHNGFLNFNQEKMSKSLGNVFQARAVLERHEPEAVRLFMLGTHYRSPLNFEVGTEGEGDALVPRFVSLEDAEARLDYQYETLARLDEAIGTGTAPAGAPSAWLDAFWAAMDDDFNTAAALAPFSEAMTEANRLLDARKPDKGALARLRADLGAAAAVLGVPVRPPAERQAERRLVLARARGLDPATIETRIAERTAARTARDFARADAIRGDLAALGVDLRDGPTGTTWSVRRA